MTASLCQRAVKLGEIVHLVQPTVGEASQTLGYVVRTADGESWFDLALRGRLSDSLGRCIFVVVEADARLAATGYLERLSPGEVRCIPTSAWREISANRRSHTRYPSALTAMVWDAFGTSAAGTVTDISVGGCAVSTVVGLAGEEMTIKVSFHGDSSRLSCIRRGVSLVPDVTDRLTANHLQFVELTELQRTFLTTVVQAHASAWRRHLGETGAGCAYRPPR